LYPIFVEVAMPVKEQVIQVDPDILGGKAVFVGTRVPVQTLFDYLEKDYDLSEFLDDFPTVKREQAIAALEQAGQELVSSANSPR
jgi:uncharacterized protein (DUF433 family)